MNLQCARRLALLALSAGVAFGAAAQAVSDNEPQPVPGRVLSDAQPLPAEDRESAGAIVLDHSRVRAQQAAGSFNASAERNGLTSAIGRNVSRLVERARSWNDVREADASHVPATR